MTITISPSITAWALIGRQSSNVNEEILFKQDEACKLRRGTLVVFLSQTNVSELV